jgi:Asp-tRNA(Asn)/Glu-tRNA(Gln) amidotransferase C subunit
MVKVEHLDRLREAARKEMERARNAGDINGVIKYARIVKEIDEALSGHGNPANEGHRPAGNGHDPDV